MEDLIDRLGSKYALATVCAKRARQLNAGQKVLVDDVSGKVYSISMREINQGMINAVFDASCYQDAVL